MADETPDPESALSGKWLELTNLPTSVPTSFPEFASESASESDPASAPSCAPTSALSSAPTSALSSAPTPALSSAPTSALSSAPTSALSSAPTSALSSALTSAQTPVRRPHGFSIASLLQRDGEEAVLQGAGGEVSVERGWVRDDADQVSSTSGPTEEPLQAAVGRMTPGGAVMPPAAGMLPPAGGETALLGESPRLTLPCPTMAPIFYHQLMARGPFFSLQGEMSGIFSNGCERMVVV